MTEGNEYGTFEIFLSQAVIHKEPVSIFGDCAGLDGTNLQVLCTIIDPELRQFLIKYASQLLIRGIWSLRRRTEMLTGFCLLRGAKPEHEDEPDRLLLSLEVDSMRRV